MKYWIFLFMFLATLSCKHVDQREDTLYSTNLQRNVQLAIIHTPIPEDKSTLNLLILNDGQDLAKFRIREIVDSLFRRGAIQPLVVVAVYAGTDRMQEYGVADKPDYLGRGAKAGAYDAFINSELYFYAKKQSGVRKFN